MCNYLTNKNSSPFDERKYRPIHNRIACVLVLVASIHCLLCGCNQKSDKQLLQPRIWRDQETEKILQLVSDTDSVFCYRYEGVFLDTWYSFSEKHRGDITGRHPDDFKSLAIDQAKTLSGVIIVERPMKSTWKISSREVLSWDKKNSEQSNKKHNEIKDIDGVTKQLFEDMNRPENSSGKNEINLKGYSFTMKVPDDLEVDLRKRDLGVTH
jgi:hypothetical protein